MRTHLGEFDLNLTKFCFFYLDQIFMWIWPTKTGIHIVKNHKEIFQFIYAFWSWCIFCTKFDMMTGWNVKFFQYFWYLNLPFLTKRRPPLKLNFAIFFLYGNFMQSDINKSCRSRKVFRVNVPLDFFYLQGVRIYSWVCV